MMWNAKCWSWPGAWPPARNPLLLDEILAGLNQAELQRFRELSAHPGRDGYYRVLVRAHHANHHGDSGPDRLSGSWTENLRGQTGRGGQ